MATLVPIEQWFRTLDRNLSSCVLKDGVKHELTSPWLSAASSSNIGSAKPFTNKNERVRKTSILRQKPPDIQEVLAANASTEKKNVRFADSMGQQLEAIKYFIKSPKVIRRHTVTTPPDFSNLYTNGRNKLNSHLVATNFTAPSLDCGFWSRLRAQSVLFHSYTTSETTVYGIVSVIDHSYAKNVYVRYTFNDWNSYVEQECSYIVGSHENDNDKFTFEIFCKPSDFTLSSPNLFHPRLFFAIRYKTGNGNEYWDNNNGKNYCLNYITS